MGSYLKFLKCHSKNFIGLLGKKVVCPKLKCIAFSDPT